MIYYGCARWYYIYVWALNNTPFSSLTVLKDEPLWTTRIPSHTSWLVQDYLPPDHIYCSDDGKTLLMLHVHSLNNVPFSSLAALKMNLYGSTSSSLAWNGTTFPLSNKPGPSRQGPERSWGRWGPDPCIRSRGRSGLLPTLMMLTQQFSFIAVVYYVQKRKPTLTPMMMVKHQWYASYGLYQGPLMIPSS